MVVLMIRTILFVSNYPKKHLMKKSAMLLLQHLIVLMNLKEQKSPTHTHQLKLNCFQTKSLKFILPVTDISPIAMTAERQSCTRVMGISPKRVQIRQRNFTLALPPSLTVT